MGDVLSLDLDPPDVPPLPFLCVPPGGVYTFRSRSPRRVSPHDWSRGGGGGGGGRGGTRAGGGGELAGDNYTSSVGSDWGDQTSGRNVGGDVSGGGGGGKWYYCLMVTPTVGDSCSLVQLESVLKSYTALRCVRLHGPYIKWLLYRFYTRN